MKKIAFIVWLSVLLQNVSGILDVCRRLHLIEGTSIIKARDLLLRIVAMLTKWSDLNKAGQGHAHGHVHENHPNEIIKY